MAEVKPLYIHDTGVEFELGGESRGDLRVLQPADYLSPTSLGIDPVNPGDGQNSDILRKEVTGFSAPLSVSDYLSAYSPNMIVNGNGALGDFNFTLWDLDAANTANGVSGFSHDFNSWQAMSPDMTIPVPSQDLAYKFGVMAKSDIVTAVYIGAKFFDAYDNSISPEHHAYRTGTVTVLTQALSVGDTEIHVSDASSFAVQAGEHYNGIDIAGYVDEGGRVHSAEGYSRWNSYNGHRALISSINGNVITLTSPFSRANPTNGGVWPVGQPIRQNSSGGDYKYFVAEYGAINTEFKLFSGVISGVDYSGGNKKHMFPPGAASVGIVFLPIGLPSITKFYTSDWVFAQTSGEMDATGSHYVLTGFSSGSPVWNATEVM